MRRRMKFVTCEHCGASLDFGERCDCMEADNKSIFIYQGNAPEGAVLENTPALTENIFVK